jgi:hypothetical protein
VLREVDQRITLLYCRSAVHCLINSQNKT